METSELQTQTQETELLATFYEPNCFVVKPKFDGRLAIARAGSRARDALGGPPDAMSLIERRLLPFWMVTCRYAVEYDCPSHYMIKALDRDAKEILLHGTAEDGSRMTLRYSVNTEVADRTVALSGHEHRISRRDKTNLVLGRVCKPGDRSVYWSTWYTDTS